MIEMLDISHPCNLPPEVWHLIAATSVTVVIAIAMTVRARARKYGYCWMCGMNHPTRPPQMNGYDFWLLYCNKDGAPC